MSCQDKTKTECEFMQEVQLISQPCGVIVLKSALILLTCPIWYRIQYLQYCMLISFFLEPYRNSSAVVSELLFCIKLHWVCIHLPGSSIFAPVMIIVLRFFFAMAVPKFDISFSALWRDPEDSIVLFDMAIHILLFFTNNNNIMFQCIRASPLNVYKKFTGKHTITKKCVLFHS